MIETQRLYLREVSLKDEEGFFELDSSAAVHEYLGRKPITSRAQARDAIENIQGQYEENGIGRWSVIHKETGQFMGWAGLKLLRGQTNGLIDIYDVGYRLIERYWGRGYATEAARASVRYGFEVMNLPEIYGMCDVRNLASRHVLEKCGLLHLGTFILDGNEHDWMRIRREDYNSRQDYSSMA